MVVVVISSVVSETGEEEEEEERSAAFPCPLSTVTRKYSRQSLIKAENSLIFASITLVLGEDST